MKPRLHNLDPNLQYNDIQCNRLRIDPGLSKLPAKKWCELDALTDAILHHHQTKYKNGNQALKIVLDSFHRLASNKRTYLPLTSYCNELTTFLKKKEVKEDFLQRYKSKYLVLEAKVLEKTAHQIGYNNGVLLSISGANSFKDKLETSLNNSDEQPDVNAPDEQAAASTSSARAPVNQLLGKRERDDYYAEDDPTSDNISVGTAIKRKALELHQQFKSGLKLTPAARKMMSSGLSSILDLVDGSADGQASLYTEGQWTNMEQHFIQQYHVKPYILPELIRDAWKVVAGIGKRNNSLETCQTYLMRLMISDIPSKNKKLLGILNLTLDIIEQQRFLLDNNHAPLISESDYLMKIWAPLFDAILSVNKNVVRLKSGECINPQSTSMKQTLYDNDRVLGFKVDFRFVFDADGGIELDVGAGEAARNNERDKIGKDFGKLLREGKDVIDGLLVNTMDENAICNSGAWIVQISGLHAQISSVHLARDGLYVCVPRGKLVFPTHPTNLDDFIDTIENMFLMVTKLEFNALALQRNIDFLEDRRRSIGKMFDRPKQVNCRHSRKKWTRPTWYSPSRNDYHLSKVSPALYGDTHVEQSSSTQSIAEVVSGSDINDDHLTPDEFGWARLEDGNWFNIYSKTVSSEHPC